GGVVTAAALLAVTKRSMPSPASTDGGTVTRAVLWFQEASAAARKVMTSAAWAGDVTSPTALSIPARRAVAESAAARRRNDPARLFDPVMSRSSRQHGPEMARPPPKVRSGAGRP